MARKKKAEKLSADQKINLMVNAGISEGKLTNKYFTHSSPEGVLSLLRLNKNTNVVVPCGIDYIKSDFYEMMRKNSDIFDIMTDRKITEVAKTAILHAENLKEKPPMIGTMDDVTKLCFHRIPFIMDANMETPVTDEMMSRTSNSEALMKWIGSLFCDESDRSQYVWIYGEGGNGKGCLGRLLWRTFGSAFKSDSIPKRTDKFWSYGLLNKRIVMFPESESYQSKFPSSGFFKSLTGGDAIRVEPKGKNSYSTFLDCKFMFLSNHAPMLKESIADKRRTIPCHMEVTTNYSPTFEEDLWKEAPGFFGKCLKMYLEMDVIGGQRFIPITQESINDVVREENDKMMAVFHSIMIDKRETVSGQKVNREKVFIRGHEMQKALADCHLIKNREEISAFLEFLWRKFNCKNRTIRLKNHTFCNGYMGFALKNQTAARNCERYNDDADLKLVFGEDDEE